MSEPATAALDTKVVSKNLEIHLVPMLVAFAEESRGGSPRDGTDIECEAGRQAGVRVPGSDGGTLRRGPWRGVDGGSIGTRVCGLSRRCARRRSANTGSRCAAALWRFPTRHTSSGTGGPLVFPSSHGTPLRDMMLSGLLRDLRIAAVPHGPRSSFRDCAAE